MDDQKKQNWLERTVLWISALLVAATFVFLIYRAITDESTSPDIEIIYGSMEPKGEYFALPVIVKNNGTQTAENVHIEITTGTGKDQQKSEIDFQYLPGQSSVKGWTTFREKAEKEEIKARVVGYTTP